jgi:hypothetical protein
MEVEAGRVARGHHAPGRSLTRACHAPMWRGRWGTRRTSEDSEDAGEPNGEAGIELLLNLVLPKWNTMSLNWPTLFHLPGLYQMRHVII